MSYSKTKENEACYRKFPLNILVHTKLVIRNFKKTFIKCNDPNQVGKGAGSNNHAAVEQSLTDPRRPRGACKDIRKHVMFRQWLLLNPKIIVNCQMSCANGRGTCSDSLYEPKNDFSSPRNSLRPKILNKLKFHAVVQMYQHANSFVQAAKKLNHHLRLHAQKIVVLDSGKWDLVLKLFHDVRSISSYYSHNDLVFCDNRQKSPERSPYRVNFTFLIKSMSPIVEIIGTCAESAYVVIQKYSAIDFKLWKSF